MGTEAIEFYYCAWVTDDLQTCINHAVKAHGDKLLKVKTPALDENLTVQTVELNKLQKFSTQYLRWVQRFALVEAKVF